MAVYGAVGQHFVSTSCPSLIGQGQSAFSFAGRTISSSAFGLFKPSGRAISKPSNPRAHRPLRRLTEWLNILNARWQMNANGPLRRPALAPGKKAHVEKAAPETCARHRWQHALFRIREMLAGYRPVDRAALKAVDHCRPRNRLVGQIPAMQIACRFFASRCMRQSYRCLVATRQFEELGPLN